MVKGRPDEALVRAAKRVRRFMVSNAKKRGTSSTLAGLCSISSFMTCAIVNDFSLLRYGHFFHRTTSCRGPMSQFCAVDRSVCRGHTHYWTAKDGWIVDATATQFGPKHYAFQPHIPAVFVAHETEERYVERNLADFLLEARYIASRLLRASEGIEFPTITARNNAKRFFGPPFIVLMEKCA